MGNKITFLFSGQGSQYYQMGRDLYASSPLFRANVDWLNDVFIAKTGCSLVDKIYEKNVPLGSRFDDVCYTHPALFVIQYALAASLIRDGIIPNRLIGMSLGEYVSLAVGGVIAPEDMLTVLIKQGELLKRECSTGGMLAILKGQHYFDENPVVFAGCELAAINMEQLICVSGSNEILQHLEFTLKSDNIVYERLPVKQAFHSHLLDSAKDQFVTTFSNVAFRKNQVDMYSSMSMENINHYDAQYMWQVIRNPILFYDTIKKIKPDKDMNYIDVGPSGTLANFVKYILPKDSYKGIFSIMTPMGQGPGNYEKCKHNLYQSMTYTGAY